MYTYQTRGVCSQAINFELAEDNTVHNVSFYGGCNGNLKGIGRLVEGMEAQKVVDLLKGTQCGMKPTSCPDQLSKARAAALEQRG